MGCLREEIRLREADQVVLKDFDAFRATVFPGSVSRMTAPMITADSPVGQRLCRSVVPLPCARAGLGEDFSIAPRAGPRYNSRVRLQKNIILVVAARSL